MGLGRCYLRNVVIEASTGNSYKDRMQYALQGCTDENAGAVVYNAFPYYANEDGEMEYYYYDNPTGVSELRL